MQFLRSRLRLGVTTPLSSACTDWEAEAKRWLDGGATSLFIRPLVGQPLSQTQRTQLRAVIAHAEAQNKYAFICDDTLLALETDAHGVFCSVQPRSLERVREVIGLRKFLGVALWDVPSINMAAVDFIAVDNAHTARRLRPLPTSIMNPRSHELHGFEAGFADGCILGAGSEMLPAAERLHGVHSSLDAKLGPCEFSVGRHQDAPMFRYSKLSPEELSGATVPVEPYLRRMGN